MKNLPYLVREQWKVLFLPYNRDQVTLGVAGSGKTVMAMYRAMYLDKLINQLGNNKKVLFLTVNRDVNNDIEDTLKHLTTNVKVDTFYSFFKKFINQHVDQITNPSFLENFSDLNQFKNDNNELIAVTRTKDIEIMEEAINNIKEIEPDSTIWNRPGYKKSIIQELEWMQNNCISYGSNGRNYSGEQNYNEINRVGRKSFRLNRDDPQRTLMLLIYDEYLKLRSRGYRNYRNQFVPRLFNFNDIYRIIPYMNINPIDKIDYIIIDEVQDVTPAMFNALNLIKTPESKICVFGDLSQNIFGQRISWKSQGITITQSTFRIFKNYRNTKPISIVAKNVIDYKHNKYDLNNVDNHVNTNSEDSKNNSTFLEPVLAQKSGNKPNIINSNSISTIVALSLKGMDQAESSVIICFNARDITNLKNELSSYNVDAKTSYDSNEDRNGKLYILSINTVKGLEFDNVILYNINTANPSNVRNDILDSNDNTLRFNEMNDDEMSQYYAKLYVSITRARHNLLMTYKGDSLPESISVALGNGDVICYD